MLGKRDETRFHASAARPLRATEVAATSAGPIIERVDRPESPPGINFRPAFVPKLVPVAAPTGTPTGNGSSDQASASALDALADPVLLLDGNLQPVAGNAALAQLLGCPKRELFARPPTRWLANPLDPRQLAEWHQLARGEITRVKWVITVDRVDREPLPVTVWLERLGSGSPGSILAVIKPTDGARMKAAPSADECDFLTGLPARSALEAELSRIERLSTFSVGRLAVLFIDLDQFKQVNDTHGHRLGDLVLQNVAQRLAASIRPGDFVARFGGDEFVAVIQQLRDETEVAGIADRIRAEVALPIDLPGGEIVVTASIGVALSEGPFSADDLLDQADSDMYRAKRHAYRRKPR